MNLVSSFEAVILSLVGVMTEPTLRNLVVLLSGWVFAPRRTVTGMLQAAGVAGERHHACFHRVFASARWSLDAVGLRVFRLMFPWLPKTGPVFVALDDTLARKRGKKVYGVGMHHDPLLSSRARSLVNWGHSWVVLGVLIEFPFRPGHWFCLPILFRLYRNKKAVKRDGGQYKTRPQLAVELIGTLCKACPYRRFHVVADSAYSGKSVVARLPENCDFTGRAHLDAQLFDPPPTRKPGTNGRPRKRGERRASPRQMLAGGGRIVRLDIYGRRERSRVASCQALWYNTAGTRLLCIVAVEALSTGRGLQAFYSTCADATPEKILTWYARRWGIETTFQDVKSYLGFQEPQGWSKKAVERTAPMAMCLYSLIVVWFAEEGHRHNRFPVRPWYPKKESVNFADMLRTLRRQSAREQFLQPQQTPAYDRNNLEALIELTAMAA